MPLKAVKRHAKSLRCFKSALLLCQTSISVGNRAVMFSQSRLAVTDALFLEPYEDAIKAQLSDHPSMTLKELQSWLESEQGLSISISAIDKFVRQKLGYRYKKPYSPVSSNATTLRRPGSNGKRGRKPAICRSWFFWMKPAPQPT